MTQFPGNQGGDLYAGGGDASLTPSDVSHLKVLSIVWYVWAGLSLLGGCCGLFYIVMGIGGMAAGGQGQMGEGPPPEAGGVFAAMGGCVLVFSLLGAVLAYLVGRNLSERRGWMYCVVIAIITCVVNIPLGTVLGIFTLVVLFRESVKQAFGRV